MLRILVWGALTGSAFINSRLLFDLRKKLAKVEQAILVFRPSGEFFGLDQGLDIENAYLKVLDLLLVRPLEEVAVSQTITDVSKHVERAEPRSQEMQLH